MASAADGCFITASWQRRDLDTHDAECSDYAFVEFIPIKAGGDDLSPAWRIVSLLHSVIGRTTGRISHRRVTPRVDDRRRFGA
jgi:hypothetical protein